MTAPARLRSRSWPPRARPRPCAPRGRLRDREPVLGHTIEPFPDLLRRSGTSRRATSSGSPARRGPDRSEVRGRVGSPAAATASPGSSTRSNRRRSSRETRDRVLGPTALFCRVVTARGRPADPRAGPPLARRTDTEASRTCSPCSPAPDPPLEGEPGSRGGRRRAGRRQPRGARGVVRHAVAARRPRDDPGDRGGRPRPPYRSTA